MYLGSCMSAPGRGWNNNKYYLTYVFRFLHECPWERLEQLRKEIPNIPFQENQQA